MPPNLGGFFMVRSYYPSECHADYFDFERIEALKPAIEDRKSGSAGMPRPSSYAVFCLKKKSGGFHSSMISWADRLARLGYAALAVDTFGPRGIDAHCACFAMDQAE